MNDKKEQFDLGLNGELYKITNVKATPKENDIPTKNNKQKEKTGKKRFLNVFLPFCTAIISAGTTAGVMLAVQSCNKKTQSLQFVDLLNCSESQFKEKIQLVEPLKKEDHQIIAEIDSKSPEHQGTKPMYAINEFYGNLFKENQKYFKQDVLHSLFSQIQYYKNSSDYNLRGTIELAIESVNLEYGKIIEENRKQLLVANIIGQYKADLTCDNPGTIFTEAEKIHYKMNGKLEFRNIYVEIEANNKEGTKWDDLQIKIWSSTHTSSQGEIVSELISTAEGTTTVTLKDGGNEKIYTRKTSDPIKYSDSEYPSITDPEVFYKDPVAVMLATIEEEKSYSIGDLEITLKYI